MKPQQPSTPPPPPARQPAPHPTLPREDSTRTHEPDASVAGEEDPGSADEELRESHRPGRQGM